jgi:hypothetical protein
MSNYLMRDSIEIYSFLDVFGLNKELSKRIYFEVNIILEFLYDRMARLDLLEVI